MKPRRPHRDRILSIRLTPAEAEDLSVRAAASGIGVSDYVRHAIAGTPIPERRRARAGQAVDAVPSAVLVGLARAGNNLNQIARWAQVHKGALSSVSVVAALLRLERSLSALASVDGGPGGDTQPGSSGG